jgi:hypothetical protein
MNAIVKAQPSAAIVPVSPPSLPDHSGAALYRISTDAAALCREIVLATSSNIQGRKYVAVEGWQSIALAHGCAASSGDVIRLEDGSVSAVGRVIRIDTGTVISSAEGYVGADEATWFGGPVTDKWGKTKILPKRADYAIRAMAQTRAISRACRSAFAHVVVMMNVGLSTTPAEEVPDEGFERQPAAPARVSPESTPPLPGPRQPVPPAKRYPVLYTANNGAWLAELVRVLNAATTEDEVVEIGGLGPVNHALSNAPANIVLDIKALLSDAMARVSMAEQESRADTRDTQLPGDGDPEFPGGRPAP